MVEAYGVFGFEGEVGLLQFAEAALETCFAFARPELVGVAAKGVGVEAEGLEVVGCHLACFEVVGAYFWNVVEGFGLVVYIDAGNVFLVGEP